MNDGNPAERAERFRRTSPGARKLATRLEDDPSTMAWVLAQYRRAEDKDDTLMALTLGIAEDHLPHLALCKRPREDLFRTDIDSIAEHIGMDPTPLANVVRLVESLAEFDRLPTGAAGGMLAAARDRAAEDPAGYDAAPPETTSDGAPDPEAAPPGDGGGDGENRR